MGSLVDMSMKEVNASDGSCRPELRTGDGTSRPLDPGPKSKALTRANGRCEATGGFVHVTACLAALVRDAPVALLATSSFEPALHLSG